MPESCPLLVGLASGAGVVISSGEVLRWDALRVHGIEFLNTAWISNLLRLDRL